MIFKRHSLPTHAVVAGIDLNGLGVVRALGGAGVRVVALDTDLNKATTWTRHGVKLRVGSLSGPAFIESLLSLRPRFTEKPVLFLTQEASVATISGQRNRLASSYHFTLPAEDIVDALLDKLRFQVLAERYGFPIPRAVRMEGTQGKDVLRELRFPCVLKPATKDVEYGKRFAKAYKVTSAEQANELWESIRDVLDHVIVQEWIEGGDSDVYFCLCYRPSSGQRGVSFVGRKVCQWPPLVGGTASCIPAPEAEAELKMLTETFFDAVGFVGMGSMEYKRDSRDGRFFMVEPTVGRTDYQEEIATLNGVNIPLAAYLGELGLPAPEAQPVTLPRAWRDPSGYARARLAGASDPMPQLSPGITTYDAYFRANDPMPYVQLKLEGLRNKLRIRSVNSQSSRSDQQ